MTGIAVGLAALAGVALGWWGAVAVAAVIVSLLAGAGRRFSIASILLILIAATTGAWRSSGSALPAIPESEVETPERSLVVSAPIHSGLYQRFVVESEPLSGRSSPPMTARTCVTVGPVPEIQLGDVLLLTGQIQSAHDLPSGVRKFLEAQNCSGSLFAPWFSVVGSQTGMARAIVDLRAAVSSALRRTTPGDAGVLLSGLVTGDDQSLSSERREAFRRTGTTHLTAVSGSNLALVAGMLASIGSATVGRHRKVWQSVTIAGVWAYAVVSGSQPPAVRAAIVAMAAILAFGFGRRPDFPTLILLAAGAMALIDPAQVDRLGFQLSVAASLALAIVLPPMIDRESRSGSGTGAFLAAATAAQVATLPLLLPAFGTVSVLSVPANLIVAPMVALAMPMAACAGLAGLFSPIFAEILAAPAGLLATATLAVVDVLGTEGWVVSIGIPPLNTALIFGITSVGLLLILSGESGRELARRTFEGPSVHAAMKQESRELTS